jgi:hypothetical protein
MAYFFSCLNEKRFFYAFKKCFGPYSVHISFDLETSFLAASGREHLELSVYVQIRAY